MPRSAWRRATWWLKLCLPSAESMMTPVRLAATNSGSGPGEAAIHRAMLSRSRMANIPASPKATPAVRRLVLNARQARVCDFDVLCDGPATGANAANYLAVDHDRHAAA